LAATTAKALFLRIQSCSRPASLFEPDGSTRAKVERGCKQQCND